MRLDRAVAERGLARSRSHAQELIEQGRVTVNGAAARRASQAVSEDSTIEVETEPWVSRAAHKLLGALDDLQLRPAGRVLDAGASTGGFTQVLLTHPVERVFAVDVGHDQLAPVVREDPRVVSREGHNLRELTLEWLEGKPVDWIVADVSFISLALLLPRFDQVLAVGGTALLMVKPQFEVGREALGKGGVVRDSAQRRSAVDGIVAAAAELGWREVDRVPSRLPGPAGNEEFFVRFDRGPDSSRHIVDCRARGCDPSRTTV